ncbi:SMP-30/gluconolactonase/LRE family protein [Sphingomonas sp.]|uniref:SMP-30/gluconolactonase/LRE family protein n=1 Tax=Sphingomonas sp. TaxID=28214 RepID=UPI0025EF0ADE|nr:SMP-30/gluconolactonase/LRE family protein [Sphingomonas sp.]
MKVERALAVGATLGEGPAWIRGALWFVDIKGQLIHCFDPASGAHRQWVTPEQVGWVLPSVNDGMIVGLQSGLHRFDPRTETFTHLHDPEPDNPGNRLNDGTTDAQGRLWFGSMDDGHVDKTGRLYSHNAGTVADTGLPPVPITNGPAISADARTLYHTDTLAKIIWRVPIQDDGALGRAEPHIKIEDGAGYPDGSVLDAENCLWTGLYGGWGIRRYDPAGALIQTVRLPVSNVTKMAFGGPDLRVAYVTTARQGLNAQALAEQPMAGDVFTFEAGVAGVALADANI